VFFNNLELMCSNKKIKMTQLLKELQLSKSAISRWRSGVLPNGEILIKIADFFECSIDYLVGRTDDPTWRKATKNTAKVITKSPILSEKFEEPKIMLPYYPQSASAGNGNYLFESSSEWRNVPKNSKTEEADFMLMISGNSMLPKFSDGDIVLVKKTPSIFEGEIGIFYIDGDAFIKQMGNGELISLNPDYPNISLKNCNDVRCFGQVIGVLDA
jgi:phage repressor protein C with HTH and peptisase S24 domain